MQPSQSVAISEATEVEPDRSVSTTADGVALSIETIRERVRLKAWLILILIKDRFLNRQCCWHKKSTMTALYRLGTLTVFYVKKC